ncbi:hypothetical protein GQ44DRAFT_768621 [Phaeosphaeriaceae sp. PMI808]|nr:hypothetical protein GQ44DRAFT_768621 [Phaeosphaeriaceae sp. PMI808]
MHNYHLPKPVVSAVRTPNAHEFIHLPPLQLEVPQYGGPQSSGMERQDSVSSTASSCLSYCSTPPTSPTLFAPHLARVDIQNIAHPNKPPFPGHRCQSCLDRGEHVLTELDKPCVNCGTVNTAKRRCGKATRKKRSDRHIYSRLLNNDTRPSNASKAEVEGGNRHDHTAWFGRLQNQLLNINPGLPKDAALGTHRKDPSWKALSNNNICKDVDSPLVYNKTDIFTSTYQVGEDSNALIENIIMAEQRLESEATKLLRFKDLPLEVNDFFNAILQAKQAECIAESSSQRGSNSFRLPPNRFRCLSHL